MNKTLYINYCGVITHSNVSNLRSHVYQWMNPQPNNEGGYINIDSLYFLFSSPGGETSAGIELYNFLRALSSRFDISMHNIGQIASIANVIYLAADKRFASPHSSFLFHGVSMNLQNGSYTLSKLKELSSHIQEEQNKIASIIVNRTKLNEDTIHQLFSQGEAKELNFASENNIITETPTEFILPKDALFTNFNVTNSS